IQLGYNGELQTEFEGYVTAIRPTIPVEVHCEDEAWKLKQTTVNKSWKQTTLKEVVTYILPDADVSEVQDVTLKPFVIKDISAYKALEKLKEVYGLTAYFRNKKPVVGLAFTEQFIQDKIVDYNLK